MAKRSGSVQDEAAVENAVENGVDAQGTDASEPTEGGAAVTKMGKRPRSNEYVLEEWSAADVPKRKGGGNHGPRDSVLDKQVIAVIEKFPNGTGQGEDGQDRMVLIAKYGNGGQGGVSAATTLRKRWVERNSGVSFLSRQLDGETRGVFVKYEPVDGEGEVLRA